MSEPNAQVAVIGGGIAGLSLGFQLAQRGVDVCVLEGCERPGGNIRSEARDGYLCEWGPNGFLDNEPATSRLVQALGLQDEVVQASGLASVRWIVRNGVLRKLPARPTHFLKSDVLSLGGRLRVLLEWAQPVRRDGSDESVFDFAARRVGREAAEILVDALVTGVYAGDSRSLSLECTFPRMREMEQRHGGLIRAMNAIRHERRRRRENSGGERSRSESPAAGERPPGAGSREASSGGWRHHRERETGSPMGPGGRLTSFVDGMETLVHALAERLDERLHLAKRATGITRTNETWSIALHDGSAVSAERIVVTSPAWAAGPLLRGLDSTLASAVESIPSAPVAVVCLGYVENDLRHLERGFGFLVPGRERVPILGTLFDTWVFPNRSRVGHVLLRSMIGGARDPEAVDETDEKLIDRVLITFANLLGLHATPDMTHVVRHPRGIPQYPVGHAQTLARIDERLAKHPGLHLAGNSYRGIAMNSCIKEAESLAERLAREATHVR
ncbi:MAG: protoporphyrinogen oxidase [Candidatus Krumholzibacteriia bacterium]